MNQFAKLSCLNLLTLCASISTSNAMHVHNPPFSDKFEINEAITVIETYLAREAYFEEETNPTNTKKEQSLKDELTKLNQLESEIKQEEENLFSQFNIKQGQRIDDIIATLDKERNKLICLKNAIDVKLDRVETKRRSIQMQLANLHPAINLWLANRSTFVQQICFYMENFFHNKAITDQACLLSTSKGFLYTTMFFINRYHTSLEVKDFRGRSLLHLAAFGGNAKLVEYLLNQKVAPGVFSNLHDKDINGSTALDLALENANSEAATMLLNACKCEDCVKKCDATPWLFGIYV